jgi:RNA-binding protein YhbY
MNLFASKKEAGVMAVVAAFFVLMTFGFTIEPLITVILINRTIPLGTASLLVISPTAKNADIVVAVGKQAVQTELLDKANDLLTELKVKEVAIQATSFELTTGSPAKVTVTDIRHFLSRLTPFDIKTILPDGTFMTETVIDPALIQVTNKNDIWTFTQTNPQVVVQKNGLTSDILVNYPLVGDIHGFESLIGCKNTVPGIKTLSFRTIRQGFVPAIFTSFLAYFKDYSCFQSFSTLVQKS